MSRFKKEGAEILVVGGAVRDMLMGREVKDWDLTTNLAPEKVQQLFPGSSFYNNVYGMVGVVIDDEVLEVTTYRTEHEYDDNRHPTKVAWGKSFREDSERRDFTINAMGMDSKGRVIDYYSGQEDLKNRLVRCVGKADERFAEDALRMLRAVRIAAELRFAIEPETLAAMQRQARLINKIAGERLRIEILRILAVDKPGDGIKILKNCGLLAEIMPEVLGGVNMPQKGHHVYDVWTHLVETLNNCESQSPLTRLAAFLHDVGKPKSLRSEGSDRTFHNHEIIGSRMAMAIGKRLKFSNDELDTLFRLVRWHMFTVSEMQTDSAVRRFIRNVTPGLIDEMIALRRADRVGSGAKETSWRWELFKKRIIEVQKQPFSIKDLKVDGKDVMEILQIKPSRQVGEVLRAIFTEVETDPKKNQREAQMEMIRTFSSTSKKARSE